MDYSIFNPTFFDDPYPFGLESQQRPPDSHDGVNPHSQGGTSSMPLTAANTLEQGDMQTSVEPWLPAEFFTQHGSFPPQDSFSRQESFPSSVTFAGAGGDFNSNVLPFEDARSPFPHNTSRAGPFTSAGEFPLLGVSVPAAPLTGASPMLQQSCFGPVRHLPNTSTLLLQQSYFPPAAPMPAAGPRPQHISAAPAGHLLNATSSLFSAAAGHLPNTTSPFFLTPAGHGTTVGSLLQQGFSTTIGSFTGGSVGPAPGFSHPVAAPIRPSTDNSAGIVHLGNTSPATPRLPVTSFARYTPKGVWKPRWPVPDLRKPTVHVSMTCKAGRRQLRRFPEITFVQEIEGDDGSGNGFPTFVQQARGCVVKHSNLTPRKVGKKDSNLKAMLNKAVHYCREWKEGPFVVSGVRLDVHCSLFVHGPPKAPFPMTRAHNGEPLGEKDFVYMVYALRGIALEHMDRLNLERVAGLPEVGTLSSDTRSLCQSLWGLYTQQLLALHVDLASQFIVPEPRFVGCSLGLYSFAIPPQNAQQNDGQPPQNLALVATPGPPQLFVPHLLQAPVQVLPQFDNNMALGGGYHPPLINRPTASFLDLEEFEQQNMQDTTSGLI